MTSWDYMVILQAHEKVDAPYDWSKLKQTNKENDQENMYYFSLDRRLISKQIYQ